MSDVREMMARAMCRVECGYPMRPCPCSNWRQLLPEADAALAALDAAGWVVEAKSLREAAEDFVRKVDEGRARSTDSYARFKAALAAAPKVAP